MSFETFESIGPTGGLSKEDVCALYDSLPDQMKTGYYGFVPQGQIHSSKEQAGADALPYVIVSFADGRKISLHLSLRSDLSIQQQADKILQVSSQDKDIKGTELVWCSVSK
jgi:hypothetical protein